MNHRSHNTNRKDPLDQKIDHLLAQKPLRVPDGFAERVLRAAENLASESEASAPNARSRPWIRIAIPFAAAAALTLGLVLWQPPAPVATTASLPEPAFDSALEELIRLE